jgi:AcrR family transcriptional regulator
MDSTVELGRRPLRADAARNRERILEAATEVFAQRGLDATLDDVARRAGVGVGTVYRRFANKEALVDALFEHAIDGIVGLAEEAYRRSDSWEGLVWFFEHATQLQAMDRGLREVLIHSGHGRERVARARERIVPATSRLMERAQADGRLRPDIVPEDFPIIEMMVGAVAEYTNDVSPDLWRRYLGIVLDGLSTGCGGLTTLAEAPSRTTVEQALTAAKFRRC